MRLRYEFVDGEVCEIEVADEIGAMVVDSRREEESADRKERRHCYSSDAIDFEGEEYGTPDFTQNMFDDHIEQSERVREAFSHLSEIQQKRMCMLASGLLIREIAKLEGKNYRSVYESIEAARKKFLKLF